MIGVSAVVIGRKQKMQPLLDDGFAVAARDPDNRIMELAAVRRGQLPEGAARIFGLDERDIPEIFSGQLRNDEMRYAFGSQFFNKIVAVMVWP